MFRSFFSKEVALTPSEIDAGPRPERPLIVVGDLHGCDYLLGLLLKQIDEYLAETSMQAPHMVFVGDYIDRGPSGRIVLETLKAMYDEFPQSVVCLKGNHEQMLLDFLDKPTQKYTRWLRNGGYRTCTSYGLRFDEENVTKDIARMAAVDLADAMGADMIAWLRGLPVSYRSGNVTIVHAAADPSKPIEKQSERVLLWGHPEFLSRARTDNQWIVHGHTVVSAPEFADNRISVDTGGYLTGVLSAGLIQPEGDVTFLQTD